MIVRPRFHVLGPSEQEAELQRFTAQFPYVASLLDIDARKTQPLFGAGTVKFPRKPPVLSWRDYYTARE